MNTKQWLWRFAMSFFVCCGFSSVTQAATTYYVRTDGGTDVQCDGKADAAYPGSGSNLACAFSHPFYVLSPAGSPSRMAGGDTMIIGPGQYMMGFGAPNSPSCSQYYPWDCSMRAVPSGTVSNPTRILGKGYDTGCASKPQLWGTERSASVLDLRSTSNVQIQCLDITDHSSCMEHGPDQATRCNRETYPYGPWAAIGIVAADSKNVLLKNVHIHGLRTGILAGRLTDWTLEKTKIIANSMAGWDGDIGANVSSNSGNMIFKDTKIRWNGCGETYPGLQPHHCYSQDQGGYGDGIGTHKTSGNWVFDHVDISHNVSDGLDLLYHDGNGTIKISHSRFEGNAGNQVKVSATSSIGNSKILGNCSYFEGKSFTSTTGVGNNPVTFNSCRANGNTVAIFFNPGMEAEIYNSTITGTGDVLVQSGGSNCTSNEKIKSRNNIYIGGTDYHSGGQDTSELYYAAGATGNGDGACGAVGFTSVNDIIWGTKNNSARCSGNTSKCIDPKIVGPVNAKVDDQDVSLQQVSPARESAVIISNIPGTDYNNYDRGTKWDIGSLEYGSVPNEETPPPVAVCGNGIMEAGEQCDGTNLAGQTCANSGFTSGTLSCTSSCTLNTSACVTTAPVCGNGIIEEGEQCDGANLDGKACTDGGFAGGVLACTSLCTWDGSGCLSSLCGNGLIDPGEDCDGTNLNGKACTDGGFAGGTLACTSSCKWDGSKCMSSLCGNGVIDSGEDCDGSNLNGKACMDGGFAGGTLACTSSCTWDGSRCLRAVCGNGVVETGEQCDGTNLSGQTCASNGFAGGSLSCSNCVLNTTNCLSSICGNGIVDPGEDCDGTNLNGKACTDGGFAGGVLACTGSCTWDGSRCLVNICGNGVKETGEICDDGNQVSNDGCTPACRSEYCGDGVKQSNEQCDDGNWLNRDGCSALCKLENPICGNGIVDGIEQCDDGNITNNDGCNSICIKEFCGDGIQQSKEGCDDRNTVSGDGCSATCQLEQTTCGNGIKEGTEKCDDGNRNSNDGCSNVCKFEYCGDGVKQAKEQCDDGNWVNRDGCSAICKMEQRSTRTRF